MQGDDGMLALVLATREANIANNTNQTASGNERIIAVRPNPVELIKEVIPYPT